MIRATTVLAWMLAAVCLVAVVSAFVLGTARDAATDDPLPDWALGGFVLAFSAFPLCGAVIASQRPRNPLGWLFCAMGLSLAGAVLAEEYVYSALARGANAPWTIWIAWLKEWAIWPFLLSAPLVFLLFPSGRLSSPRWRPILLAALAWPAIQTIASMLSSWPADSEHPFPHPLPVPAPVATLAGVIAEAGVLGVVLFPIAAASLLARYRRAGSVERQQLKWLVYAAALVAIAFIFLGIVTVVGDRLVGLGAIDDLIWFGALVSLTTVPIAAGIAILRHRLYDIDLLINRTLVYGALTATLALAYAGSVVLLQQLSRPLTQGSDFAVAGSTLAVAALFQPVRRRIQSAVDRRFYRSKYDAQRTIARFSARLRQEVDLYALQGELGAVVRETMQPAHVSLWLREGER